MGGETACRLPEDLSGVEVVRQILETASAPASALFSQGVKAGPLIFVSGMVGIDAGTGEMAGDTIQAQTRQALLNCAAVLDSAGASLEDVAEVGVLLTNPDDFNGMNEAYRSVFPSDPPARYVTKLGVELPNVLVSIRMTAYTAAKGA